MGQFKFSSVTRLTLLIAAMLTAVPAIADKPSWAGGKQEKKQQKQQKEQNYKRGDRKGAKGDKANHDRDRSGFSGGKYFIDRHRTVIRDYYADAYRRGHCPPGLAKKRNGCMPPGQAKKWAIGSPLPRDVIFYDLPPAVLANFGPPPPGYRFVRVASDILMIAIGTGMVKDAIHDLGGL